MTRVLALTRYGALGASSRLRFLQYLPYLADYGIHVAVSPLFADDALRARYQTGAYQPGRLAHSFRRRITALRDRHRFDLLWIEKECLPWVPMMFERRLLRDARYALDYDDAIFHNYDQHRIPLVRSLLGRRIDELMAGSSLVVAGNPYLAARARQAGARVVRMLPTVIDLNRYPPPEAARIKISGGVPRIVWIGSPTTVHYLEALAKSLQILATRVPFVLRVIGATPVISGVDVEPVLWCEDTEVAAIAACDLGLMPLVDSPWERGKCGYKLVQYMACGLPVVASPVGVNSDIVSDGVTGFLADRPEQWVESMEQLLRDAALRRAMGTRGRQKVETSYCLQVTAPIMATLLQQAVTTSS